MPSMSEMFPSKYLRASDCEDGDLTLTIASVQSETIGQGQKAEEKWIVYFEEDEKGLVLNKTNTTVIVKLHGDNTDDWIGHQVTLFSCDVQFGTDMVAAIRVRSKAPKKPVAKPATAAPAQQPQQRQAPVANGNGGAAPRGQAPVQQQRPTRAPAPQDPQPDDDPDSDIPF